MDGRMKRTVSVNLLQHAPWLTALPARCALMALLGVMLLALMAAGCQAQAGTDDPAELSVTPARIGSLSSSVSGEGALLARQTAELSFPVSGTVAALHVQAGDKVAAGQLLAELEGQDALQVDLRTIELSLAEARKTLDALLDGQETTLAQAVADLSAAQSAYEQAQKDLHSPGDARCAQPLTESYYYEHILNQAEANYWSYMMEGSGYGTDYLWHRYYQEQGESRLAYLNWKYCEGYTDQEIAESQAALQLAEASLGIAQADMDRLFENAGLDPQAVEIARAEVKNLELQLAQAQAALTGASLRAPFAGTVLSVAGSAGEAVGTDVFLVLADLEYPLLKVTVDETDLYGFAQGCDAQVVFTVAPERTFTGVVGTVYPSLSSMNRTSVLNGLVELDAAELAPGRDWMPGMRGTVDISCVKAEDAVLAPISALVEEQDGSHTLFILDADGNPRKTSVEVGWQDSLYAEIKSGLQAGDLVLTDPAQAVLDR
jgi:HlyD family secretion protein